MQKPMTGERPSLQLSLSLAKAVFSSEPLAISYDSMAQGQDVL